jgi:lipopolysaccharide/colanic/teichoic acid biosynthesis glycosyltransferase
VSPSADGNDAVKEITQSYRLEEVSLLSSLQYPSFFIPMILIALMVKLTSKGPALYWPERIEKENCLVPGVTGWVKINGRDELPIPVKVQHDEYYLHHQSFGLDLHILALTIIRVAQRSGVTH